jgi:hypothetical protein
MPRARAGVAAATATTSRFVGQTLGVALVGAIAGAHAGQPAGHAAWWALAACGAAVLALGLLGTSARAGASARRTAAQLNPEAVVS